MLNPVKIGSFPKISLNFNHNSQEDFNFIEFFEESRFTRTYINTNAADSQKFELLKTYFLS